MSQRILKFRIWDKIKNKFVDDFCLLSQTGGISTFTSSGMPIPPLVRANDYEEYVIQQFTGLKDKNKKEIYEGDIVRFQYGATTTPIGEIKWDENRSGWFVSPFDTLSVSIMYNVKIVGNIFENLNLLGAN